MKQDQLFILAGVLMLCCCSSSAAAIAYPALSSEEGPTGPSGPAGPTGQQYTESCDDLGGGVIERIYGPINLTTCKQKCSADSDCLGFIHKVNGDFCQLHDNKTITNVDVCDSGLKVYRK